MEVLDRLGPGHLRAVVEGYRDALAAHREALNRLNVYPVPDGDTGTNMALTLESVVAELPPPDAEMAAVCRAVSHGSLMGARGNSGVILSQILRGLTDGLAVAGDAADGAVVADALGAASRSAYGAVMHPVEGTILTVAREASEAAEAVRDHPLVEVLDAAADAARASLARTPDLLPVLAEAGVVDAGGAGFVLLLEVLLHVVDGRPVPSPATVPDDATDVVGPVDAHVSDAGGPRYEVMFLLEAPEDALPAFKESWDAIGDSIVVVGGDGTWNCHIHTDDIGPAVEAGIRAGRPYRIEITDLHDQVTAGHGGATQAGHACQDKATQAGHGVRATQAGEPEIPVATAVVAVAAGDGVGRILRSLGVGRVVAGGQSMNPSTAEILAAVEGLAAKEVVVLPNNKNVVAVARQVAASASRPVTVVPTTSVVEAFAALLAYDADADADVNARAMADAAGRVVPAEVVQAVREAATAAGPVRAGEWLGVTADGIAVVAADAADAACALLDSLLADTHELVTIVEGTPSTAEATRRVVDWLADHHPDVTVEVHDGGQPLTAWLLSVE